MSDEVEFSTMPFLQGRKLLEQLGVTMPRAVQAIAAPDPDLDPSIPASFGGLTTLRELKRRRGRAVLAHDDELGRSVVVRLLTRGEAASSAAVDGFIGEARLLARLGSGGVPSVHSLGHTEGGDLFFVTDSLDGRSLRESIDDRTEGWTAGRAARVALRMAEVLARAHDRRVVLGSLDPRDVMLGNFGELQIADWSAARMASDSADEQASAHQKSHNRTAQLAQVQEDPAEPARPRYGSPEQARGEDPSPLSDVFVLGALLFEMLTREPAFDDAAMGRPVLRAPSVALRSDVPEGLGRIVARALQVDPANRYPSMLALREALAEWLDAPRRGGGAAGSDDVSDEDDRGDDEIVDEDDEAAARERAKVAVKMSELRRAADALSAHIDDLQRTLTEDPVGP